MIWLDFLIIKSFLDVAKELINKFNPDTIIHLAEHRAAPYSMKNSSTARYTVNNNLNTDIQIYLMI